MGESLEQKAVRRAIGERWPISPQQRRQVVCDLVDILADVDADYRARVRAGQVLGSLDALNLKEETAAEVQAASAVPGVTVNITNAQVTVAPSAMTSFLADCIPPAPQVIEHQANPPEQSPS